LFYARAWLTCDRGEQQLILESDGEAETESGQQSVEASTRLGAETTDDAATA